VIDIVEYRRLKGETVGFMDYLRSAPYIDGDLDLERRSDPPRDTDVAG
jgi:hypothetical protein